MSAERLTECPGRGEAIYDREPGARFGVYRPDSFWFADGGPTRFCGLTGIHIL